MSEKRESAGTEQQGSKDNVNVEGDLHVHEGAGDKTERAERQEKVGTRIAENIEGK